MYLHVEMARIHGFELNAFPYILQWCKKYTYAQHCVALVTENYCCIFDRLWEKNNCCILKSSPWFFRIQQPSIFNLHQIMTENRLKFIWATTPAFCVVCNNVQHKWIFIRDSVVQQWAMCMCNIAHQIITDRTIFRNHHKNFNYCRMKEIN